MSPEVTDLTAVRWRNVGRVVYAQPGPEPADTDPQVGVMDTAELAHAAAWGHNVIVHAGEVRERFGL